MQVSSRDNSSGAEIERVKANQAALEARLAAIEPKPPAPKVDAKALKAEQAARQQAIADLQARLEQRHKHLVTIDRLVDELCEAVRAERTTRQGLLSEHFKLIEKEVRRTVGNDTALVTGVQRKIGNTLRPTTDQKEISFERLGDEQALAIMQTLEAREVDELLR